MCGPASRASLPFFFQRERERELGEWRRGAKTRDRGETEEERGGGVKGASLLSFSSLFELKCCVHFIVHR